MPPDQLAEMQKLSMQMMGGGAGGAAGGPPDFSKMDPSKMLGAMNPEMMKVEEGGVGTKTPVSSLAHTTQKQTK